MSYCSVKFKTGQELDEALSKALCACDDADKALAAKVAIENMGAEAITLDPGADATVTKTVDATGAVTLTFGVPRGVDGIVGKDGSDGEDGNGIKSAVLNADYTLTLTFDDGTSYTTPSLRGATGASGKDGSDGAAGKDGTSVTVQSVSESTEDGGSNVVTFSDGKTVTIKNGSKGNDGVDGNDGADGSDGIDGLGIYAYGGDFTVSTIAGDPVGDGGTDDSHGAYDLGQIFMASRILQNGDLLIDLSGNIVRVTEIFDDTSSFNAEFVTNIHGAPGEKGDPGDPGATPVKGTDYFTEADKTEMVNSVIASLTTETWTFTLEDDSTVNKVVLLK